MAKNIFNSIAIPKHDSNTFSLNHDHKSSFRMGALVPTMVLDCIPGDRHTISVENMLRLAPLISPVMHKVIVTTHFFFVPNRLLWPGWEDFITGKEDNVHPYVELDTIEKGSVSEYMGLPIFDSLPYNLQLSPMQVAAYRLIYDEYYRDQNLQAETFTPLVDGDNSSVYGAHMNARPFNRAWQHDYFTASLPTAQEGTPVQIPLTFSENIPVEYNETDLGTDVGYFRDANGNVITAPGAVTNATGPTPQAAGMRVNGEPAAYDPNGTLTVDVQSDAVTINVLRRALKLQQWFEASIRGGQRYIESILSHFGVRSSDKRLQRPEYVGGATQNMVISEVLSTAQTDGATSAAVGQMAGHVISVGGGNTFSYFCEEHGFLIGIINVRPTTSYQQGVPRQFTRFSKFDYPFPIFGNIGEQEVLNKEVYVLQPTLEDANGIFGYGPRYSEMKYMPSRVSGDFRDNLSFWHLGRIFASPPALNAEFIECDAEAEDLDRIFSVTADTNDHVYAWIFNKVTSRRKLPRYGIPSI